MYGRLVYGGFVYGLIRVYAVRVPLVCKPLEKTYINSCNSELYFISETPIPPITLDYTLQNMALMHAE